MRFSAIIITHTEPFSIAISENMWYGSRGRYSFLWAQNMSEGYSVRFCHYNSGWFCRAQDRINIRIPKRIIWLIHFFSSGYLTDFIFKILEKMCFWANFWCLVLPSIIKFDICGDKTVTRIYRSILLFYSSRKWSHFGNEKEIYEILQIDLTGFSCTSPEVISMRYANT